MPHQPDPSPTYGDRIHDLVHQLDPDNPVSYARTMAEISAVAAQGTTDALADIAAGHSTIAR